MKIETGMTCPKCGRECDRDEVDVGVGIIHGPYGCVCGWSEDNRYNVFSEEFIKVDGYVVDSKGGLTPIDRPMRGFKLKGQTESGEWVEL